MDIAKICLPCTGRLGSLTPKDVPTVLDRILEHPPQPFKLNQPPIYIERWRGRMGLNKDDQLQLYKTYA